MPEISSHKRYDELLKYYGFSRMEDAYIKMAVGKLSFEMIYKFLYQKSLGHTEEETLSKFKLPFLTNKKKQKTNTSPIIIEGTSNILVNFAKCCNPILGDSVKAYITAKKGIVIHRSLCWQLSSVAPERFVEVDWADNNSQNEFTLDLQVVCHDKTGILSKLGEVFNSFDLNIIDVDIVREADFKVFLVFKTRVKNTEQLQKLIDRLHKVDSVMSVSRKINMDLN